MLTVQGSQKVANLGVGDSPALHGRKSKQPTDTVRPLSACLLPHCGVRPPTATPLHFSPIFRPMLNPFD